MRAASELIRHRAETSFVRRHGKIRSLGIALAIVDGKTAVIHVRNSPAREVTGFKTAVEKDFPCPALPGKKSIRQGICGQVSRRGQIWSRWGFIVNDFPPSGGIRKTRSYCGQCNEGYSICCVDVLNFKGEGDRESPSRNGNKLRHS